MSRMFCKNKEIPHIKDIYTMNHNIFAKAFWTFC